MMKPKAIAINNKSLGVSNEIVTRGSLHLPASRNLSRLKISTAICAGDGPDPVTSSRGGRDPLAPSHVDLLGQVRRPRRNKTVVGSWVLAP